MQTPGTTLRQARELRGLSLNEVAQITRISRTTIAHIEADHFEELPAQVFVRGFLRNLAKELKVDADGVIAAYEHHTGRVHKPALEAIQAPVKPAPAAAPPRRTRIAAPLAAARRRLPSSERITEVIGSAKPAYVIGSLVAMLVLALIASVITTSGVSISEEAPRRASWNVKADGPKARWILDGQSNLSTARLPLNTPAAAPTADEQPAPQAAPQP